MSTTHSTVDNQERTYLWCETCRRSYRHHEVAGSACPVCGNIVRPIGKFSAILRGLMSNELAASPLETRHRQLVRLIWTANGMGERYYKVLGPEMSYARFESRVTALLCEGAEAGWVRFVLPAAPTGDESAYKLEFDDEDRFISELQELVTSEASPSS